MQWKRSQLLSRQKKKRLYYCLSTSHNITHACETWANTKGDEEKLDIFERKYGSDKRPEWSVLSLTKKKNTEYIILLLFYAF